MATQRNKKKISPWAYVSALLVALVGGLVYYILNRKKVNDAVTKKVVDTYTDQLAAGDAQVRNLWNSGQFKA